jgi:RNA polymerase sigma-70 factor, ECF subfamily
MLCTLSAEDHRPNSPASTLGHLPELKAAATTVPCGSAVERVILVDMSRALPQYRATVVDKEAAFDRFFADSCQFVVGLVTVTTGDAAAAEDAVQEAYLRAHQRWGSVALMDRPDLWVAKVASRIAVSSWRSRRREAQLTVDLPVEVADSLNRIWLKWGLESLSPKQRFVLILHHIHGLPLAEVAAAAGSSTETVRTHLKRARLRLRRRLFDGESYE